MESINTTYPRKKIVIGFGILGLLEMLTVMVYFFDFVRGEVDLGTTIFWLLLCSSLICLVPLLVAGFRIANKKLTLSHPKDSFKILRLVFVWCVIFMSPFMLLFMPRPDIVFKMLLGCMANGLLGMILSGFILPKDER